VSDGKWIAIILKSKSRKKKHSNAHNCSHGINSLDVHSMNQ